MILELPIHSRPKSARVRVWTFHTGDRNSPSSLSTSITSIDVENLHTSAFVEKQQERPILECQWSSFVLPLHLHGTKTGPVAGAFCEAIGWSGSTSNLSCISFGGALLPSWSEISWSPARNFLLSISLAGVDSFFTYSTPDWQCGRWRFKGCSHVGVAGYMLVR